MTSGTASRPAIASHLDAVTLTVVLPCRDEEESVASCVRSVYGALAGFDGVFEVVVVDNASSDRSQVRATGAGARVVYEAEPGYGNACRAGIRAARGRVIVLADADGTYDFRVVPEMFAMVAEGHDLVLGSRLRGRIEAGAMPWLHRVGTPILTGLVNLLFQTELTDVNCGMRAISAEAAHRLDLAATGMEFASEMVVKASSEGLRVTEVPVDYLRRRSGEPKLRTWRDGRRHLSLVVGQWLGRGRLRASVVTSVSRVRERPALEPGEPPV